VPAGCIYGVLGPNGAGKTTTIRMLATLIEPDSGSARVLGHDVVHEADAVRGLVSLTGQLASVDEELTGRENLVLVGGCSGHRRAAAPRRADELLDAFGLTEAAASSVKHFSGGMRRRPRHRGQPRRHARSCSSSTSRPRASTRARATRCGRSSGRLVAGGHDRACSARSTSRRPTSSPTASRHRPRPGHRRGHPGAAQGRRSGSGALRVRLVDPRSGRGRAELRRRFADVERDADPPRCRRPRRRPTAAAQAIGELSRQGVRGAEFSLGRPSLDEVFLALTGAPAVSQQPRPAEEQQHDHRLDVAPFGRSRPGRRPQGHRVQRAAAERLGRCRRPS
jgi:ABC-2 type transport system ATP-binding protein